LPFDNTHQNETHQGVLLYNQIDYYAEEGELRQQLSRLVAASNYKNLSKKVHETYKKWIKQQQQALEALRNRRRFGIDVPPHTEEFFHVIEEEGSVKLNKFKSLLNSTTTEILCGLKKLGSLRTLIFKEGFPKTLKSIAFKKFVSLRVTTSLSMDR